MTVEFINKVMRTETCYDMLQRLMNSRHANYQEQFAREMIGLTVLTDYNNQTYRIDDVDFGQNPLTKFDRRDGPISYKDYYSQVG